MLCAHGVFPWSCDRCRPSSVPRLGPAPAAGSATGPLPAASSLSGQSSLQPNRLLLRLVCPRGRTFSRLPSEGSRLPVVWDSLSDWCHSSDFLLVRGMPSPGLVCPSGQDAENVLGALALPDYCLPYGRPRVLLPLVSPTLGCELQASRPGSVLFLTVAPMPRRARHAKALHKYLLNELMSEWQQKTVNEALRMC